MKNLQTHSDLHGKVEIAGSDKLKDITLIREEVLARLDVMSLLSYFEIQAFQWQRGEIRCACPVHHGKHNNFMIRTTDSSGSAMFRWTCFSHNCEEEYGSDIFGFVEAVENCSFYEAVKFLIGFVGLGEGDIASSLTAEQIKSRNELSKVCSEIASLNNIIINAERVKNPYLNEDFVSRSLKRRNNYFKNRGFSDNVLDVFEVGHCSPPDSAWNYAGCKSRAVIPIRDENMKLVGISGRAESSGVQSGDAKYRILGGSDKESNLYGLCYSFPHILKDGNVIIVEGFADLWKCWMAGYKNVVAVMGKKITEKQLIKLVRYATSAFIVFDFDEGRNEENVIKIRNYLSNFMTCNYGFISETNDLGGSTVEEVKSFFEKNARFV